jgi:Na+/melibiose symporter-like transporter
LGIFIPGLVFGDYEPNPDNYSEGRSKTFELMFIQALMGLVCFGVNVVFQENKPPTPPSDSGNVVREPFNVAIPRMLKNKNYLFLLLAFGCYFGIFNGISIILSYLLKPWFGSDDLPIAVAAVGGSPIISGILGVIIIGPLQRKSG